jgi:hypothetical protein
VTPESETSPARKSVGFNATNTIVEEVLANNEDSVTVACKQLVPVSANTVKHKTTLFIKVKLQGESKLKDPTSSGREQTKGPNQRGSHKLKELGEILIWQDPSSSTSIGKPARMNGMHATSYLSSSPQSQTSAQSYMNGFRPSPESGDVWGSLQIGINEKAASFSRTPFRKPILCGSFGFGKPPDRQLKWSIPGGCI